MRFGRSWRRVAPRHAQVSEDSPQPIESLMGLPGIPQVFQAARNARRMLEWQPRAAKRVSCEDSLRPVHARSRHPAADAGRPRDSPRAQGVRAAGDARAGSSESRCPRPTCSERLWPDTFVAEANLSNLVAEIREALGDQRPRACRTCGPRTGSATRFAETPRRCRTAVKRQSDRPVVLARVGQRRFPLSTGEHVIGRDPDVEIRLDASTVSRRHARLVVKPEGTVLEDFGSKNGTFRGSERVTSPVQLADGDAIHIGSLLVTFHVRAIRCRRTRNARPAR